MKWPMRHLTDCWVYAVRILSQCFRRLFYRLIADDAIWYPGGITHLDISLSMRNNFYWAFQQLVWLFQKAHTSLWQFTRIPSTLQIIARISQKKTCR